MSHFTKCELKMTNLAALKQALTDLQLEGKKRMGIVEFLRGYRFKD